MMTNFLSFRFKWLLVPLVLLTLSIGQVWGAVATLTFSSTPSNNKVYTDGHSKSWTLTSDNAGYWALDGSTTIHAGSGSKSVSHITFTSGGYHGETITKITVTGYGKNVGAYATINGSNFGTQNQTATSSGTRTFTGTTTVGNSGNVVVKLKRNSASKDAIYCSQIQVFYYTTITLDKNGGLEDGDIKFDHDAANCVASSFHAVTRDGYTCTGYWTAASGGTKILNDDGSLAGASITVDDVPYTSSATKWAYTGATLTLYAQWESAAACTDDPSVAASIKGSFS